MFTVFVNSGKTETMNKWKVWRTLFIPKFSPLKRQDNTSFEKLKRMGDGEQLLDSYDFAFFEIGKVCF